MAIPKLDREARRAGVEREVTARRGFRRVSKVRREAIRLFGPIARSFGSLALPEICLQCSQRDVICTRDARISER